MSDEDAPWRPSRGLSLAPAVLCALEDALSPDDAYATASVGDDAFAIVADETDDLGRRLALVRIDALDPPAWTEVSRHGWWATEDGNASAALAELVDQRRAELPVDQEGGGVTPIVVVPGRNGIDVLHLTPGGIAITTQLFDRPDELVRDSHRWSTFEEAMHWVAADL